MRVRAASSLCLAAARITSLWSIVVCALLLGGCATWNLPRLDPTGEHILIPAGSPTPPFPPGAPTLAPPVGPTTGLSVNPSALIAPVGSQVVLIASVIGGEGYLLTNEVVEWTIDPTGVGQFLSPGERRRLDLLNWWRGLPRKVDSRYAINATLKYPLTLDRGTPSPYDDIFIQTGQSWVTVTSPTKGTSHVTAFAPGVTGWDLRQQTSTIYWIDAQWQFPAPAITPAGDRNTLVTTVTRQTDGLPLAGWQVRYEIAGGPPAEFSPGGATTVELITNEAGQAAAEITQSQPSAGTNQINISLTSPAGIDGRDRPLTVGAGSTLQTWASSATTPPIVAPQPAPVTMPESPADVTRPATLSPPTTAQAELTVAVTGPQTATVGQDVQFQIDVTNRGTAPASGLIVTNRFDAGLEHDRAVNSIERDLIDLQPGGIAQLIVNFRVTQPGTLCQAIEVTGAGGLSASARHCITASEPPIAQPTPGAERWEGEPSDVTPTPQVPPVEQPAPVETPADQPAAQAPSTAGASLSVRKTGPNRRRVGDVALFTIEVTNNGDTPLQDVVIADNFETTLEPGRATEGNEWLEGNALGWRIGTLDPGQTVRRDIELRCLQATPRACNRATVTARNMQPVADEACLEIVTDSPEPAAPSEPAKKPLGVSVAETTDPLRVGSKTTYYILIENNDAISYFDVQVSAKLSPELKLDTIASPVGTQGDTSANAVRFEPVREFRAGEAPLSFELHVTAVQPGQATVQVEVKSHDQTAPVKANQSTQVIQ